MKYVPLAEAKAKLSGLVDEVSSRDERVTITKRGRPAAVLMSHDEMQGLEATLEIMSDPEFYAEILRSEAALDRGEGRAYTLDELFGEEEPRGRKWKGRSAARGTRRPAATPTRTEAKGARHARRAAGRSRAR